MYPSAIYYSNRRVLSSPSDVGGEGETFIGRSELAELIRNNGIKVVIGNSIDVEGFVTSYNLKGTLHTVNDEEMVFESTSSMK